MSKNTKNAQIRCGEIGMGRNQIGGIIPRDASAAYRISLFMILIISAMLRFRGLGVESFWLDELTTLDAVDGGDWRDTMEGWLSMVGMGTWLLYWWAQIVGTESDYALRSVSAIAGVILIYIVS